LMLLVKVPKGLMLNWEKSIFIGHLSCTNYEL
jgi:hypothetical protein